MRRRLIQDDHVWRQHSRRDFLGRCVAATIASMAGRTNALAWQRPPASASGPLRFIDVHHHALPPKYLAKKRDELRQIASTQAFEDWTIARSLEEMDRAGVRTAFVSLSTPGVWTRDVEETRRDAREANEYMAGMMRDHPDRFGVFAVLAFPDVDGTLKEIEYALDVLHVDGFGIMTNDDDKYPGDPQFDPILQELNRRKAVVYLHPTKQACCANPLPNVFRAIEEFPFDTTRAVTSLLYANAFARYPDIKWIFSHGGGTIPFLAGRIGTLSRRSPVKFPQGAEYELRKAYFEMTSATSPATMAATLKFMSPTHLLAGTDFPFGGDVVAAVEAVNNAEATVAERRAMQYETALTMFPRLKK